MQLAKAPASAWMDWQSKQADQILWDVFPLLGLYW